MYIYNRRCSRTLGPTAISAESSETSAQGILEIVEGKRDSKVGKFVTKYGKQFPW